MVFFFYFYPVCFLYDLRDLKIWIRDFRSMVMSLDSFKKQIIKEIIGYAA
jgi:DNA polymerase sigma